MIDTQTKLLIGGDQRDASDNATTVARTLPTARTWHRSRAGHGLTYVLVRLH